MPYDFGAKIQTHVINILSNSKRFGSIFKFLDTN